MRRLIADGQGHPLIQCTALGCSAIQVAQEHASSLIKHLGYVPFESVHSETEKNEPHVRRWYRCSKMNPLLGMLHGA